MNAIIHELSRSPNSVCCELDRAHQDIDRAMGVLIHRHRPVIFLMALTQYAVSALKGCQYERRTRWQIRWHMLRRLLGGTP